MTTPNRGLQTLDNPLGEGPSWDRPADKIRADLGTQVDRIRNRKDLNAAAAKSLIAQKYVAAQGQMAALSSDAPQAKAAQIASAKRAAFGIDDLTKDGTPAEAAALAMNFRDAQQRAAQLATPEQASALYDTANQSGDELLTRAVGNRAVSDPLLGADDVADTYLASHPDQAVAVAALNDLLTVTMDAAQMFEYILPKPSELGSMNDSQIAAAANTANTFTQQP